MKLQPDQKSMENSNSLFKGESKNLEFSQIGIGNQIWMSRNLEVDKFRNGDIIAEVNTKQDWIKYGNLKKPAYCYYENLNLNSKNFGKLYNWYAVNDPRGLAPEGWHIPDDGEWEVLIESLTIYQDLNEREAQGSDLKSKKNNLGGFLELYGGGRDSKGRFIFLGTCGFFWSATSINTHTASLCCIQEDDLLIDLAFSNKSDGFSVRCIK
jgi:uncharacterized protein (TIGR02145 family)